MSSEGKHTLQRLVKRIQLAQHLTPQTWTPPLHCENDDDVEAWLTMYHFVEQFNQALNTPHTSAHVSQALSTSGPSPEAGLSILGPETGSNPGRGSASLWTCTSLPNPVDVAAVEGCERWHAPLKLQSHLDTMLRASASPSSTWNSSRRARRRLSGHTERNAYEQQCSPYPAQTPAWPTGDEGTSLVSQTGCAVSERTLPPHDAPSQIDEASEVLQPRSCVKEPKSTLPRTPQRNIHREARNATAQLVACALNIACAKNQRQESSVPIHRTVHYPNRVLRTPERGTLAHSSNVAGYSSSLALPGDSKPWSEMGSESDESHIPSRIISPKLHKDRDVSALCQGMQDSKQHATWSPTDKLGLDEKMSNRVDAQGMSGGDLLRVDPIRNPAQRAPCLSPSRRCRVSITPPPAPSSTGNLPFLSEATTTQSVGRLKSPRRNTLPTSSRRGSPIRSPTRHGAEITPWLLPIATSAMPLDMTRRANALRRQRLHSDLNAIQERLRHLLGE